MDPVSACFLALLEMTFVLVVLLLLHSMRKAIGPAGFYVSLGLLFVFTQLVGAADLKIVTGFPGINFHIASTILQLPFLTMLMVIYIADRTVEAQRLIIALIAALGVYTYLASMTVTQIGWGADESGPAFQLSYLFRGGIHSMAVNVVSFSMDLFLLPIIYQRLRNWGCRLFVCVTGALFIGQVFDSVLYASICYWGQSLWMTEFAFSYLSRAVSILLLSGIAWLYLSRIEVEEPGSGRRSLDIIVAFFGASGRAKALEHDLMESEDRYRLLFRGADDMILSMSPAGIVIDANPAALRLMGLQESELGRVTLQSVTDVDPDFWSSIPSGSGRMEDHPALCGALLLRSERKAEFSFTPVPVAGQVMLLVFGRDVTEREKLNREREQWQEERFHNQRLESIGRLAGGIAHDFNNLLHAMQGHLDIIRYMHPVDDPDVNRHIDRIDAIAERASLLTRQLLGFARKGNYNESDIELTAFLRSVFDLFLPGTASTPLTLVFQPPADRKFPIRGDMIQLQQAILNILFNARDAMRPLPESERRLIVSVSAEDDPSARFSPPQEVRIEPGKKYCAIRIQDSGPGISPQVLPRIFEPFFTTKPVGEGTGMGLSMAYGILLTHKGWLEADNSPEGGALLTLILPLDEKSEGKKA